jgi:hypothetical protein
MSEKKDFKIDAEEVRNAVLSQLKETLNRQRQLSAAGETLVYRPYDFHCPENNLVKTEEPSPPTSDAVPPQSTAQQKDTSQQRSGRKQKVHVSGKPRTKPEQNNHSVHSDSRTMHRQEVARAILRAANAGKSLASDGQNNSVLPQTAKQVNALDTERQRLNNRDFEEEIKLKKYYGKWFLVILACQLLVMNGVFILDGWKVLSFEDVTLRLYMGGTLTEVFGLVLVVTKYLFKRK